jgi:DNA-binding CsgD family transcriptional regulator
LACNLADTAPLVVVVDDVQWCDAPSLRWLVYLARRLDGIRLALFVAERTGEPDAGGELLAAYREEAVVTIALQPLSASATGAVVEAAVGRCVDPRFRQACHRSTGGNPFFLRALVAAVQEAVIAPTAQSAERVERMGPASVRRQVLARLARLGAPATALARAVSVLDGDAEPGVAYLLAGLEPDPGGVVVAALEAARILAAGESLRFAHPILRAAVYQDMPAALRSREHRRAAQVLIEHRDDPDRAAVHLLATRPAGDRWVCEQLEEAAERALQRGAADTALVLLERALAEPSTPAQRPRLLLAAGRASRILARPEAKSYLTEACRASAEPGTRADAASELAQTIWHTHPAAAVDALRSALAGISPPVGGAAERLRLELLMTETTAAILPPAEIEQQLHQLSDAAPPGSPLRQGAACVLMWHHELWSTRPDRAAVDGLARELRDPQPLIKAYGADFAPLAMAAGVLGDRDQHDTAGRLFDVVAAESQRGHNAFALNLAVVRAYPTALAGEFADAEAQARAALEHAVATGSRTGLRAAVHGLMWALIGRGANAEIDAILTEHGLDSDVDPGGIVDAYLLLARSVLRCAQGRHREGCDDIVRAMDVQVSANPLNRLRVWAPRVLAAADERRHALELASCAIDAGRASGFLGQTGIVLHSAGLADRGRPAIDLLTEAVDVLARSCWRWEHAEALVDLGAALRRANRRLDARDPLQRGLRLALRIGALALAERASQELVATGARPRALLRRGVDALTVSERRVAALAAEGRSISEIAQRLFVTRKTVETHLYAAYRKLDVTGRDALRAALAGDADPGNFRRGS